MYVRCYCAVHKTLKFLTVNAGSGSPEKAEAKSLIYNSRKGSISMTTFSRTARAFTVAAVVGLSMGVSAPAVLAQPVEPAPTQVQKGNIDFSKKGSLLSLIHI